MACFVKSRKQTVFVVLSTVIIRLFWGLETQDLSHPERESYHQTKQPSEVRLSPCLRRQRLGQVSPRAVLQPIPSHVSLGSALPAQRNRWDQPGKSRMHKNLASDLSVHDVCNIAANFKHLVMTCCHIRLGRHGLRRRRPTMGLEPTTTTLRARRAAVAP